MNGQINVGGGENVTPEVVEQTSLLEKFAAMLITKGAVPMSASTISYDNSESGLTATDVQSAIDEVKENAGKITSISVNGVAQPVDANKNVNITVPEPDLSAYAPMYSYGTTDLTAGTSPLENGKLYFVYE